MRSLFRIKPRDLVGRGLLALTLCALLVSGTTQILAQAQGKLDASKLPSPVKHNDIADPESDPEALKVVERYLEALGGREVLAAIEDRTVVFDTIKHAPAGETTAALKQFLKRGARVREEWDLQGFSISDKPLRFVQVYNGVDGWVQMFGTISPLEGRTLSIFVWDKAIDDFFMAWQENGYSVEYLREDKFGSEAVHVVQTVDYHEKTRVKYFFSKESGLLLKKEWRDQDAKGFVKKVKLLLNYRRIPFKNDKSKGVKMSLHQQVFIGDDLDTEQKFTQVEFNSGLKDAIFDQPEGVPFKGGVGPDGKRVVPDVFKKDAGKGGDSKPKTPQPLKLPTSKKKNPHGKKP